MASIPFWYTGTPSIPCKMGSKIIEADAVTNKKYVLLGVVLLSLTLIRRLSNKHIRLFALCVFIVRYAFVLMIHPLSFEDKHLQVCIEP